MRPGPASVLAFAAALVVALVALRSCDERDTAPDGVGRARATVLEPSRPAEAAPTPRSRVHVAGGARPDDAAPVPDDDPLDFSLTTGRVTWPDGSPAADALVLMGDLDDTDDVAWTDDSGRFGFDTMAHYSDLYAFAQRDGVQWRGGTPVDGWPIDVEIPLHPATASETVVLVHVTGHDGGEIDHAIVDVAAGEVRVRSRTGRRGRMHAANGWFVVVPERWEIAGDLRLVVHSAQGPDGAALPYGPALVDVDVASRTTLEVTLPPGRTLSGLALDPQGRPVAGVTVELDPTQPDDFDRDHMREVTFETRTNEQGEFAFHGQLAGPFTVRARAESGVHGGSEALFVESDGAPLVLRLVPEIAVRVRVVDPGGVPIPGARYSALGRPTVVADADGMIRLTAIAQGAPVRGHVVADGMTEVWISDWRPEDGETRAVVLAPAAAVRGVVLGPDAEPLRNVLVRVEGGGNRQQPRWTESGFEVGRLPLGATLRLWLRDEERDLPTVDAVAGDDVTLRWPADERFTLYAEGAEARDIVLLSGGSEIARGSGWPSLASFDPAALPPNVDVVVLGDGDGDGTAIQVRDVPTRSFRRLAMKPGATLTVRAAVPDDLDVRWLRCTAETETGLAIELPYVGHARFRRDGLPHGTYRVTLALAGDGGTVESSVDVCDDTAIEIDVAAR